jgi:uncharacterized protein with HEPN domain
MSKKPRNVCHFIDDILVAIGKIEKYSLNLDFETFRENEMVLDALVRNFEIIGEATKNIPFEIRDKYPEIEWKEMIGFRNVIIHGYFQLDTDIIWDTLRNNIPSLKKHIQHLKDKECV